MKTILGYLILSVLVPFLTVLKYAPRAVSVLIARTFVWTLVVVILRRNAVGMRNLEIAFPEKSETERKKILFASYNVIAENLREFARLGLLNKDIAEEMMDWADLQETVRQARSENPSVGIFFPTLHFGSYEMVVQCYALLRNPVSILARGVGNDVVDAYINAQRERHGNTMFSRKGGYKEIEKTLNAGRDVAVLVDQNVKRNHAIFVEFFGVKAATTKTVALAALRTGCPIIFNASYRVRDGLYKPLFARIHNPFNEPGDTDAKLEQITRDLNKAIEEVVRAQPAQWFWIHRRFKTRPEGESENLYSKSLTTVSTR